MPADALASEVVDSTLAAPVAASSSMSSAPHASGDVGSDSEVPDFAQRRRAAMHFAIWCFFCGLVQVPAAASNATVLDILQRRRSAQQLPSNAWLDATESILVDRNRLLSRPAPQVLRHNDRVVALRFPGVRWRRKAEASTLTLSGLSASACNGRMIAAAVEKPDPRCARSMLRRLPLQFTHTLFRVSCTAPVTVSVSFITCRSLPHICSV